jgi:hypothetical protein
MDDLEPGDFLYQANQELFLVCIANRDEEVEFAVHGWRTIDKERLDHYLDPDGEFWEGLDDEFHTEERVREVIDEADDPNAEEKLEWLNTIFEQYAEADIAQESAHSDFALDDT